jgi:tetratricopeptide (TPR) repeat protein
LRPLPPKVTGFFLIMHVIMKIYFYIFVLAAFAFIAACGPKATADNAANPNAVISKDDSLLAALNAKIASEPNNFQHYLERAKYYGSREKYDLAFRDIARAITTDSTQATIYLTRGELYWQQQNVNAAYEDYKKCVALDGKNSDCLLKKAAIDIVLNNYSLALEHINTALKQGDQAYAYYLKGRLYKQKGDTTLAASSYQTAIEVDPTYYDAYIEVGLLYATRKHDLAKEYYNSAIELRPKSIEAWYNKAMFLQETGNKEPKRYDEAIACYDSIAKIDPTFAATYFNKGFVYFAYLKDLDKAQESFTKAVVTNPEYFAAYYNRGLVFEKKGLKAEAEADFRKALSIKPDYTEAALSVSRIRGEK